MPAFSAPSPLAKRPCEHANPLLHHGSFQGQDLSASTDTTLPFCVDAAHRHDEGRDGIDDSTNGRCQQPTGGGALVIPGSAGVMAPAGLPSRDDVAPAPGPPGPGESAADDDGDMSDGDADGGAPLDILAATAAHSVVGQCAPPGAPDCDLETEETYGDDGNQDQDDGGQGLPAFLPLESHDVLDQFDFDTFLAEPFEAYPGIPGLSMAAATMDADLTDDADVDADAEAETDTDAIMTDDGADDLPPLNLSNPTPNILGPPDLRRYDLLDFLQWWGFMHQGALPRPRHTDIVKMSRKHISEVQYADLEGDRCDFQGIDWEALGTTRNKARATRPYVYQNHINRKGSDVWAGRDAVRLPRREDFFRFRRMDISHDVNLAHFQLRSGLACPSRSRAFYADPGGVRCFNPVSGIAELFIGSSEPVGTGAPVSALDANHGVVMGGTLHGNYCLRAYEPEVKGYSEGTITNNINSFTNHIKIQPHRRTSTPVAAIASNDSYLRVMDIEREEFVLANKYRHPLNCSALSPDRQLRVGVGDDLNALIMTSETGEVVQQLSGHRDHLFGCDWSDDGWTVATSSQDMSIKVWDARRWCDSRGASTPLCTMLCELSGAPNLRFSPVGSGRRMLVAAESGDFVHLIDGQTFASKQTVDVFSEIGGIDFSDDGQNLTVLCTDPYRGGLLQLERCGRGPEPGLEDSTVPWEIAQGFRDESAEATRRPWLSAGPSPRHRRTTVREAMDPF